MRRTLLIPVILLVFSGCNPAEKSQKNDLSYFDLKGYFEKEALRLNKRNPVFTKTVMVNKSSETKKIQIRDWEKELSVFSEADINRSAWKGLFHIEKNMEQEVYTSDDKKVPVKEVLITKRGEKVQGIKILMRTNNMLYSSADTLSYYPDSLYQIKKKQEIRLLSEKNYIITGKF
ncbi:MAG: hypothetical protein WC623_23930 [Pedobacter sp.]|uniref:hypothetical protein n=1 Tax=Pedobacter sp. TaxID=1411316 RepID=UPI0035653390